MRRFIERGPDPIRLDLTNENVYEMAREFVYSREGLVLDTDRLSVEECFALVDQYVAAARNAVALHWYGAAKFGPAGA